MPKLLIVAGELSGDLLGANLMAALKARQGGKGQGGFQFYGIGGPAMHQQGLHPLADLDIFPGMGITEVIPAIPALRRLLNRLANWSAIEKPVAAILIDNQEFSAQLSRKLSPLGIPCLQYVAPKVWAWRQHRVKKLARHLKHIFCLFPFETGFFTSHGLPATYIGHPVALRLAGFTPEARQAARKAKPSLPKTPKLALLPGSRRSEFRYNWPTMLQTYRQLRQQNPALKAIVALADEKALRTVKSLGWDESLTPVLAEARFKALQTCTAALIKSGTNNLELALLGIPAVVIYRMSTLTYAIASRLVKLPSVSPVNLVANGLVPGPEVFPEYLQHAATPATLQAALNPLLADTPIRHRQIKAMATIRHRLTSKKPPADQAAEIIMSIINHKVS